MVILASLLVAWMFVDDHIFEEFFRDMVIDKANLDYAALPGSDCKMSIFHLVRAGFHARQTLAKSLLLLACCELRRALLT